MWLLPDYPDSAPLCYVIPGRQMELAVSPYLDHAGLVELPCLQEWDHSSTDLRHNTHYTYLPCTFQ